jgi:YD repeat-containing protein
MVGVVSHIIKFNSSGQVASITDAYNQAITYSYTNGQLTTISDPNGRQVTFTYVPNDNKVATITGPDDRVVSYEYDSNGNLTGCTTPRGKKYRYGYQNGVLTTVYHPKDTDATSYRTTYAYQNNQLVSVTDPLNNVTTLSYDSVKREATVTDPKGNKDIYGYNVGGNPAYTIVDADHLALKTSYLYEGNLLKNTTNLKDQSAAKTSETYSYDDQGNVLTATDNNLNATEQYQYNSNNDVTKETDTEGKVSNTTYLGKDAVSTSAQDSKTASVSQYDSYGNEISGSAALAPGDNLVTNGSFESGLTSWTPEVANNNTSSSLYTTPQNVTTGLGGLNALQLTLSPQSSGWGTVQETQTVSAKKNTTYTLSADVKTSNVSKAKVYLEVALLERQFNICGTFYILMGSFCYHMSRSKWS